MSTDLISRSTLKYCRRARSIRNASASTGGRSRWDPPCRDRRAGGDRAEDRARRSASASSRGSFSRRSSRSSSERRPRPSRSPSISPATPCCARRCGDDGSIGHARGLHELRVAGLERGRGSRAAPPCRWSARRRSASRAAEARSISSSTSFCAAAIFDRSAARRKAMNCSRDGLARSRAAKPRHGSVARDRGDVRLALALTSTLSCSASASAPARAASARAAATASSETSFTLVAASRAGSAVSVERSWS